MKNGEYIEKWLEGTLSEKERLEFEQTTDYQELRLLDERLTAFRAPDYNENLEYERLRSRLPGRKREGKTVRMVPFAMKIAAAVAVFALATLWFLNRDAAILVETASGEKTQLYLPDSSVVILNAASSLSYSKSGWDERRSVKLNGEAFFAVRKGSDFVVETSSGVVQVLGTEFNVRDRSGLLEVVCYEGLVQLIAGSQPVKIPANFMYRKELGLTNIAGKPHATPHLRENESAFQSVILSEVIGELERQYDISINTDGIDVSKSFTGRFTHRDLELALKAVTLPMNISYTRGSGKNITFTNAIP